MVFPPFFHLWNLNLSIYINMLWYVMIDLMRNHFYRWISQFVLPKRPKPPCFFLILQLLHDVFCGWIEQFVLVCPGQTTFLREIFQRPGRHQGSVLATQQGIRARSVLRRLPMENFSRIFRQISDYHPTDVDFKNHPQFGKWSDKSLFGVC